LREETKVVGAGKGGKKVPKKTRAMSCDYTQNDKKTIPRREERGKKHAAPSVEATRKKKQNASLNWRPGANTYR